MVQKQLWSFQSSPKINIIYKAPKPPYSNSNNNGSIGICSVSLYIDHYSLATRSVNGGVKIWDIRNTMHPICINNDLPLSVNKNNDNNNSANSSSIKNASISFSPDGTLLITPTLLPLNSDNSNTMGCALAFLDRSTLEVVKYVDYSGNNNNNDNVHNGMTEYTLCSSLWNNSINQIFVCGGMTTKIIDRDNNDNNTIHTTTTTTNASLVYNGFTSVLYSSEFSSRGALLVQNRNTNSGMDITDYALKINIDRNLTKSIRVHERNSNNLNDNKRMKMSKGAVVIPHTSKGVKGRTGSTAHSLLQQKFFGNTNTTTNDNNDPRQSLLKYADKPNVFTAAYEDTQPVNILDCDSDEDDDKKK